MTLHIKEVLSVSIQITRNAVLYFVFGQFYSENTEMAYITHSQSMVSISKSNRLGLHRWHYIDWAIPLCTIA